MDVIRLKWNGLGVLVGVKLDDVWMMNLAMILRETVLLVTSFLVEHGIHHSHCLLRVRIPQSRIGFGKRINHSNFEEIVFFSKDKAVYMVKREFWEIFLNFFGIY
jgi:hypothetical protein